jgi:hypothetical protein
MVPDKDGPKMGLTGDVYGSDHLLLFPYREESSDGYDPLPRPGEDTTRRRSRSTPGYSRAIILKRRSSRRRRHSTRDLWSDDSFDEKKETKVPVKPVKPLQRTNSSRSNTEIKTEPTVESGPAKPTERKRGRSKRRSSMISQTSRRTKSKGVKKSRRNSTTPRRKTRAREIQELEDSMTKVMAATFKQLLQQYQSTSRCRRCSACDIRRRRASRGKSAVRKRKRKSVS